MKQRPFQLVIGLPAAPIWKDFKNMVKTRVEDELKDVSNRVSHKWGQITDVLDGYDRYDSDYGGYDGDYGGYT